MYTHVSVEMHKTIMWTSLQTEEGVFFTSHTTLCLLDSLPFLYNNWTPVQTEGGLFRIFASHTTIYHNYVDWILCLFSIIIIL